MTKTKTSKAVKQQEVETIEEENVKQVTKKVTQKKPKTEVLEEELVDEETADVSQDEKKKRTLPTRDTVILYGR